MARRVIKRVPRRVSLPMLINRGLQNDALELRERQFVEAFAGGWATTEHFDNLADMRDCLMLAVAHKGDAGVLGLTTAVGVALLNIKQRYAETKRMGASGEELKALRVFVEVYKDYWLRQPVCVYEAACEALSLARGLPVAEGAA